MGDSLGSGVLSAVFGCVYLCRGQYTSEEGGEDHFRKYLCGRRKTGVKR